MRSVWFHIHYNGDKGKLMKLRNRTNSPTTKAAYTRGVILKIVVYDDRRKRPSELAMLADAVLHTGFQENNRHCDAEASGVILLKFSRCLHWSAGDGCELPRALHTKRRVVFLYSLAVLLIGLYYVRIPLLCGEILM